MSIDIRNYSPDMLPLWEELLQRSKNGTFILSRPYMEYHSDRFTDASLVIWRKDKPFALLPASAHGRQVRSHGGLTYGGLIIGPDAGAAAVIETLEAIARHFRAAGFDSLLYKPVPQIYHTLPADEDLYALWRLGAQLHARQISAAAIPSRLPQWKTDRRQRLSKARRLGLTVRHDWAEADTFYSLLADNLLAAHGATPVHSLGELKHLKALFPDNISLHTVHTPDGRCLGGTVIYLCGPVAHTQYISANDEGKHSGAIDILFHTLLTDTYARMPLFDFGTSNADSGHTLCESLIHQKEGFGARAAIYDQYLLDLQKF